MIISDKIPNKKYRLMNYLQEFSEYEHITHTFMNFYINKTGNCLDC